MAPEPVGVDALADEMPGEVAEAPAPAPAPKERRSREPKPLPTGWAPSGATLIKLAGLGIAAGPTSPAMHLYREAMRDEKRWRWTDKIFADWCKANRAALIAAQPKPKEGQQALPLGR